MHPDTIRDYLLRADMNEAQADALSRILAEMATTSDVLQLKEHMRAELGTMRAEFGTIRAELGTMRAELRTELSDLRAELTWKLIAIVGFFATVSTLLNLFVG